MHFLLTILKVVYVLNTARPLEQEEETMAQTHDRQKWDHDDYICRGYILNGMSNTLFNAYQRVSTIKNYGML